MFWNKKIKDLREDHDLTQTEMAHIINTTQRTISYYENNERDVPIEVIIKYAKYFKLTTDEIVGIK